MWCIGELTAEYRRRMYEMLDLYARPHDPREPVICLDEKCKQLLRETRRPLPAQPGTPAKHDYEYERAGICNLFVAVEPRGQRRFVQVTARRTKIDFVAFVCRLLRRGYTQVRKVHLVLDNLNTHMRESFEEVLGLKTAAILPPHLSAIAPYVPIYPGRDIPNTGGIPQSFTAVVLGYTAGRSLNTGFFRNQDYWAGKLLEHYAAYRIAPFNEHIDVATCRFLAITPTVLEQRHNNSVTRQRPLPRADLFD